MCESQADHALELDSLKSQHTSQINTLKTQHTSDLESLTGQHNAKVSSMTESHSARVDALRGEMEGLQAKHASELIALQTALQTEREETRATIGECSEPLCKHTHTHT